MAVISQAILVVNMSDWMINSGVSRPICANKTDFVLTPKSMKEKKLCILVILQQLKSLKKEKYHDRSLDPS